MLGRLLAHLQGAAGPAVAAGAQTKPASDVLAGGWHKVVRVALERLLRCCLPAEGEAWESEEPIRVLQTQLTRAFYLPRYAMAKSLADVFGTAEGIEQMKAFLDAQIAKRPRPASPPESLRELRDRDIPWNLADGGQDAISALRSENELLKKVTACRIQKVLEPYGDPELMETIACYPDFASIRKTNEHFVLTRTQNLIRGGEYCDTCFHDVRGAGDDVHPSREVFDGLDDLVEPMGLGPEGEEEAS